MKLIGETWMKVNGETWLKGKHEWILMVKYETRCHERWVKVWGKEKLKGAVEREGSKVSGLKQGIVKRVEIQAINKEGREEREIASCKEDGRKVTV